MNGETHYRVGYMKNHTSRMSRIEPFNWMNGFIVNRIRYSWIMLYIFFWFVTIISVCVKVKQIKNKIYVLILTRNWYITIRSKNCSIVRYVQRYRKHRCSKYYIDFITLITYIHNFMVYSWCIIENKINRIILGLI